MWFKAFLCYRSVGTQVRTVVSVMYVLGSQMGQDSQLPAALEGLPGKSSGLLGSCAAAGR